MTPEEILKHKVIIVADDHPANRDVVVKTIMDAQEQAQVLAAKNGKEVLRILEKRQVHLILLDWDMPEMDGYQVLLEMKIHPAWSKIPVLMYTGVMTSNDSLVKAFGAGAHDFIRKPTEPVELLARITSVISRNDLILRERELMEEQELMKAEMLEQELSSMLERIQTVLIQSEMKNKIMTEVMEIISGCNDFEIRTEVERIVENALAGERQVLKIQEHYTNIASNFTKLLHEKHPGLSPAETRLCVLTRSGLGTKEIAGMLNLTPSAVEKTRYRVRKKLGLSPVDSFESYIRTI
jgi:DNA-binding response OmpR family regulator